MSEGSGQRYCGNCGAEIRSGTSFCVSCGQQVEGNEERTEANASFGTMGSGPTGGSSLNQRNIRLGLLGVGALLVVAIAYFVLSYSMTLGFLLIVLLTLAVLVIRKNRGLQTRREQQLFDTTNRYKESAQKAYDEGKHRDVAQNAYQQSRKVYEEANTLYQRWNQQKADERRLVERGRIERINPDTGRVFTDGRRFRSGDNVIYVRNSGEAFDAVVLNVTPNEVRIEFVGNSLEMAGNLGLSSVIRVAPMKLRHPWLQSSDAQDLRLERERGEQERRLERYRQEELRRQEERNRQEELRRQEERNRQEELRRQRELLWYQTAKRFNMPWYQTAEFHNEEEEAKFVEREMRLRGEPPLLLNMGSDGDGGTKWEERWIPLELLKALYFGEKFDELVYEEDGKRYWKREIVKPNIRSDFVTTLRRIATRLEGPRQWLREKVKDGPTYISVQEIGNKASDWGHDNEDEANSTIAYHQDILWEGEFVPVDEHETQPSYTRYKGSSFVRYTGIWVERVY